MPLLNRLFIRHPALMVSLFLVLFCNTPLWQKLFAIKGGFSLTNLGFYAPFFVVLTLLLTLFFSLFRFKYVFKSLLILFLLVASAVDYFMSTYGVVIDNTMLQNALETHTQEALELVNAGMLGHLSGWGLLPAIGVWKLPISYQPFFKQLKTNGKQILLCLTVMGVLGYLFYGDYTSIYRNDRQIRYLISPINAIDALVSNLKRKYRSQHPLVLTGADASLAAVRNQSARKNLTILVIGETARAANFSLNGYPRPTNPLLSSQENLFNFSQAYSCGTATAASVPCMFSVFGRENYDASKASYTENLVDVLKHAGISVLWRNNNDSCKGVCERVAYEDLSKLNDPKLCNDTVCYDEVLLYQLQAYLDQLSNHAVIVLHQQGSHGPGYHLRHPAEFNRFTPECSKAMLNDCSQAELVNAYDNTIVYTDYFLAQTIKLLKANAKKFDTALFYVSDHGESLGENNVFLHGLPYFIAPEQQKHVPMLSWLSDNFISDNQIQPDCLHQHSATPYSHDNLFHSILGLMGVSSSVYDPKLDLFADCRT